MEVTKEKFKSAMQISDQGVSGVAFKMSPLYFIMRFLALLFFFNLILFILLLVGG